jgi:hypothetical protein
VQRLAAVIAAAAIAAVAGGCGEEDPVTTTGYGTEGVGMVRAGSSAALAQCSDWLAGTDEQKQQTIDDIYNQLNQAGADGPTPDIPDDDEAREFFDQACSNDYARGFRLYKIYARHAAFSNLAP